VFFAALREKFKFLAVHSIIVKTKAIYHQQNKGVCMKNFLNFLIVALVGLFLNACSEDAGTNFQEPQPTEAKFSSIQINVFNRSCAIGGCHNGSQSPNLSGGVSYNNIVNRPSTQRTNLNYIEPGDPNSSYLYLKLIGSNITGDVMPRGQGRLSRAVTDSIKVWIENGALNN
jgi:hypothetical protein